VVVAQQRSDVSRGIGESVAEFEDAVADAGGGSGP
jgi:hypothetical protein